MSQPLALVPRRFLKRWFAVLSLVWLSRGSVAQAADPSLEYLAPEGCPTQAAFAAAVESRGASLTAGWSGEPRQPSVQIRRDAQGFTGTFQLGEGEAASELRRVHGATCAEVSEALAVVTAIALQSDAAGMAPVVPAASAPMVLPSPFPAPAELPLPSEHVELVLSPDRVPVEAGTLDLGYVSGQTLRGGAAFGVIPNLTLPRLDFSLSRANRVTTPGNRDYLLGGIFRVRWSFLGVGTLRSQGLTTTVWGLKAGIGSCTPLLYQRTGVELKVCAEIAAGIMSASTRDAAGVQTQDKQVGIGTAGAELDAQYNINRWFHVGLTLGGEMWLSKVSAERPDGGRIFESNLFNAYALVGLGLRFW